MNLHMIKLLTFALLCCSRFASAGFLSPHLTIAAEAGATRSYLKTDSLMTSAFAPTSDLERTTRPAGGISVHLRLGNYLGITSGMGYRHFGQYTRPASVYFKNNEFDHDFESRVNLHYFAAPLVIKAGIRRSYFSVFAFGGIQPSLVLADEFVWTIDGREMNYDEPRNLMPPVEIETWDVPLRFGGEAGFHFGKNGIVLAAEYNYGVHSIASGVSGKALVRSYGATLQYRRELF